MNNKFSLWLFALPFLILFYGTQAQTPEPCRLNAAYFKSYVTDTKNIISAPLKWKPQQVIAAGLLCGGVIALMHYDEQITFRFQDNKTTATSQATKLLEPMGNGLVVLGGSALLYTVGALSKESNTSCAGLQNMKAVLISSAFIFGVKHLTHRSRPFMNQGSRNWNLLSDEWQFTSFPSGHATFAFATATSLSCVSRKKIVPIIAYTLAGSVALSRIHDNKHWSSDVLAGAAIGTAFSLTINKGFRKK
jgi:hypothetical protein